MQSKLTEIVSIRKGAVRFKFENENEVSIIFGAGSYTENYDLDFETRYDHQTTYFAKTIEVMVNGEKLTTWLEETFDGENPAGHIPVERLPEILEKASTL